MGTAKGYGSFFVFFKQKQEATFLKNHPRKAYKTYLGTAEEAKKSS